MGLSLHYTEYGAGRPLVVLHGLFGSSANWRRIARALASRHHVFALDARNHGASPWADDMHYTTLAEDVGAFIAERGLEQAAVLGHSMGGKTAMMLALTQAAVVERLIVVDIAPVRYRHSHGDLIAAMRGVALEGVRRRADAEAQLRDRVPNDAVRGFLLQNLVQHEGGLHWRINLPALDAAVHELVDFPAPAAGARYVGPTLFVHGTLSDYVLPQHGGVIRALFPAAEIVGIIGAGHWLHAERPDAVLQAIETFLGGTTDAAG